MSTMPGWSDGDLSGVRKCAVVAKGSSEDAKSTTESDLKDAMKWFGILVPQALRQSQQKLKLN